MKKRENRTRLIHVTHLVIIVSSYLYIIISKNGRKTAKLEGVCRREQSPIHTKSHSLTHRHTHTQVHEREKERKSHTHRDRQTDRMFIPYFSETETSGDIISDRERKRGEIV